MAMNKAEKLLVQELKIKISLHFTEKVTEDIPVPESFTELSIGYTNNMYTKEVRESCSTANSHNPLNNRETDRQNGIALFSTKILALKSLRNSLEHEYASELRAIDMRIEKEIENADNS